MFFEICNEEYKCDWNYKFIVVGDDEECLWIIKKNVRGRRIWLGDWKIRER